MPQAAKHLERALISDMEGSRRVRLNHKYVSRRRSNNQHAHRVRGLMRQTLLERRMPQQTAKMHTHKPFHVLD